MMAKYHGMKNNIMDEEIMAGLISWGKYLVWTTQSARDMWETRLESASAVYRRYEDKHALDHKKCDTLIIMP
jgi:hypothetical protein